jgi:hypothetical protein
LVHGVEFAGVFGFVAPVFEDGRVVEATEGSDFSGEFHAGAARPCVSVEGGLDDWCHDAAELYSITTNIPVFSIVLHTQNMTHFVCNHKSRTETVFQVQTAASFPLAHAFNWSVTGGAEVLSRQENR